MAFHIFEGAGLYLYNPEPGTDLREFVRKFKNAGGHWIAFLLQEGTNRIENPKNQQLMNYCDELGVKKVGSSWLLDKPIEEAKISRELAVNLDGWIANGEQPLCYSQDWGFCPDCFQRSSQWTAVWGGMRPTMFSSFTHFRNHDIDYKPWIQNGAFAGPQAYVNEWGWVYGPDSAIGSAMDVGQPWNGYIGFPPNRIAPVGGSYLYSGRPTIPVGDWLAKLKEGRDIYGKGYGFSYWPGELIGNIPNSWADLENGIKNGHLARYEGDGLDAKEPPVPGSEFPYTGPYYGPKTNKPLRKGPTAKALKIAMHRMGFGVFTTPDIFYNLNLEMAMRRWQAARGLLATGNYGIGSWEQIRKEILPDGKRALTPAAIQMVFDEYKAKVT